MKRRGQTTGFTIVELLIVIVVIGILAAITVVAYNGIQQRAKTSAILGSVDAWEKIVRVEATKTSPVNDGTYYQCLGRSASEFPAGDGFVAGECYKYTDSSGNAGSIRFDGYYLNNALLYPQLPSDWWSADATRLNGIVPTTSFVSGGATYRTRGVIASAVKSPGVRSVSLYYGTQNGQCGRGTLAASDASGNPLAGGLCFMTPNL